MKVRRALISVSDKSGLDELAASLVAAGVEIVSSGGTARHLAELGIPVTLVADVTGHPEILEGRVKTLHPAIHGGILARQDDSAHMAELADHGIDAFQLVVAGLYPFEATVARGADPAEVIENIDIGGPAMIRAAAKNHDSVAVVTDPSQYPEIIVSVQEGDVPAELRRRLAAAAFYRTAAYDASIVSWFDRESALPERLIIAADRAEELRYGENPHQPAGLYGERGSSAWWRSAERHQGKAMSFNNYGDAEAAWRLACDLPRCGVAVIKHMNPCGVAVADDAATALRAAWECDPLSAFGSVIAMNTALTAQAATFLVERYVEVVLAPEVDAEARSILAAKPNVRVLSAPAPSPEGFDLRRMEGGFLVQRRDVAGVGEWRQATSAAPDEGARRDLELAWIVAAHTKSNAIVIAGDGQAVGIGAGDQSRVGAARRALSQAGERAKGAVAASDAFFPFADGIEELAAAGIVAIVQPGGSMRDEEVIAAADQLGVAMMFTGERHFRH